MEPAEIFKTVKDWLHFAEAKNAALIGLIGIYASVVFQILQIENDLAFMYVCSSVFFLSLSSLVAFVSFMPRLELKVDFELFKPSVTENLYYFEAIASMKLEQYKATVFSTLGIEEKKANTDLIEQIYAVSHIASYKMKLFRLSLLFAILGIFTPASALGLFVFYKNERRLSS